MESETKLPSQMPATNEDFGPRRQGLYRGQRVRVTAEGIARGNVGYIVGETHDAVHGWLVEFPPGVVLRYHEDWLEPAR